MSTGQIEIKKLSVAEKWNEIPVAFAKAGFKITPELTDQQRLYEWMQERKASEYLAHIVREHIAFERRLIEEGKAPYRNFAALELALSNLEKSFTID